MIGMLNKHLDSILPLSTMSSSMRDYILEQVTAVDITNAARWFYEETDQEEWDWRDSFPCVTPPWTMAWFEFKSPEFIRSGSRIIDAKEGFFEHYGYNTLTLEIPERKRDTALKTDIAKRMLMELVASLQGVSPEVVPGREEQQRSRMEKLIGYHNQGMRPRWIVQITMHGFARRKHISVGTYSTYVDENGQLLGRDLLTIPHPVITERLLRMGLSPAKISEEIVNASAWLMPVFFATSLMHCKNVTLIDTPPPQKVMRRRRKDGKRTITYKQLLIEPLREQVRYSRDDDDKEKSELRRALHICRGHFKDYRGGKGLFGKHRDIYWWDMHLRGREENGTVIKSYKVGPVDQE